MTTFVNISTLADHQEGTGLEHFNVLEDMHKALFPQGMSWVILQKDCVMFKSTIRNRDAWQGGYEHNDPMRSIFEIKPLANGKYTVHLFSGDTLAIAPPKGSHLMFGRVECKFRKYTGTFEQVLKKLRAWEEKRLQIVEDNKDNMRS